MVQAVRVTFYLLVVASIYACASRPAAAPGGAVNGEVTRGVRLEPPAGATPSQPTAGTSSGLPGLSIAQVTETSGSGRRMEQFDAVDQELRVVLQGLAESYGISLQIDPQVRGRVTARLRNATLQEALAAVVTPHGYEFSLDDGVLRVGGARLQTRIFTLDYVSVSRFGSSSTTIQRRVASSGGGGGVSGIGSGFSGGGDQLGSVAVADLWEEIRVALDGLVFDVTEPLPTEAMSSTPAVVATTTPQTPGTGVGAQSGGARAYSRSSANGRKLIINPIAGSILVSAPPAKLAEVATFISAFEGSVQRQVLIEAKIVDVTLKRETQFGIDWNAVMRLKNLRLGITAALTPSAQGVSLSLGNADGSQINAVLRALESQGDVQVLLSPRVSALNNQRAVFQATTEEVVFTVIRQPIMGPNGGTIGFNTQVTPQQISVGLVLDVLPQISADNTVTMNIRPHVTSVLRFESIKTDDTESRVPVIDTRETDTMIRVRGGETIIIGGLMQTRLTKEKSGIPGLSSIPGIGKIFSGTREITEKAELVIFITPTIIASQPPGGR